MIKLIAAFFILSLLLTGCTKPDPNPHLGDYIYQDIQRKLGDAERIKSTVQSNYEDLLGKVKNVDRQTREFWVLKQKAFAAKWEVQKAQQKIDYFRMLLFEREKYVRESYLKSFAKGDKWDNSDETRLYKKSAQWEINLRKPEKPNKEVKDVGKKPAGEHEPAGGGEE